MIFLYRRVGYFRFLSFRVIVIVHLTLPSSRRLRDEFASRDRRAGNFEYFHGAFAKNSRRAKDFHVRATFRCRLLIIAVHNNANYCNRICI